METFRRLALLTAACAAIALALVFSTTSVRAQSDTWVPIGPRGGNIYTFALDQTSSTVIYAPYDGQLYVTQDGGATWQINAAAPPGVSRVVLDPQNHETIYAFATGKLYRSTDAGASWPEIGGGGYSFAIDPAYPNRLVIGGMEGGIRKSTNRGDTWSDVSIASYNTITALAVSPDDSNTIYAGTGGDGSNPGEGIYISTNGGLSWTLSSAGLPSTDIGMVVVDPLHPDTIFASTRSGPMYGGYGLYRSTNRGGSWSPANAGLPCVSCPYDISINDLKAITGRDAEFRVIANGKAYQTDDGGGSWNPYLTNMSDAILMLDFRASDPDLSFFGSLHGIWRATPNSLERLGVVPIGLTRIAIDPLNPQTLYAAGDIVYKSSDGGAVWELSLDGADWGTPTAMAIDPVETNILFVGRYNSPGGVFRSVDAAASWDKALAANVNDIEIDPVNPNIVYAGCLGGLYKSMDRGIAWGNVLSSVIMHVAVDPSRSNTIYVGTHQSGIKKSTDGGAGWAPVNAGLPANLVSNGFVSAIAIDPFNTDILYCGTIGYGVFKSADAADEWVPASTGLTTLDIRKIVIDGRRPSILYAQTYAGGVFRSVDGARSWDAINTGLPSLGVRDLAIDPASPDALYSCSASGLFRCEWSFNPSTGTGSMPAPPLYLRSFPNPFSSSTSIEYSVSSAARVRISVYDVSGRLVATLVDRRLEPGRYTSSLRGTRLSAGVYFIEGKFGDQRITKKCVLMK